MLSLALTQPRGFILTWTQWQQSLPPRGLALECHSISWHCIHYLLQWKGVLHTQPCLCCCRGDGMSCSLSSAHSPQDCETLPLVQPRVPTGEHSALPLLLRKREVFILNHKWVLYSVHVLCLSPDEQWESGICLKLSLLWSAICSW